MKESMKASVREETVLEKFEGEAHPDNLIERVYLLNGEIQKHEFIKDGQVLTSWDKEVI